MVDEDAGRQDGHDDAEERALSGRIVVNHVYHHRGQLSVYLRLLNVPVPSIYGPSADEGPAGSSLKKA